MLQGRVAGLNVINSGQPGAGVMFTFMALATLETLLHFILLME